MRLATALSKGDFAAATNYSRSITVQRLYKIRDSDPSGYRATIVTRNPRGDHHPDQIRELTADDIDELEAAIFRVAHVAIDWEV